MQEGIDAAKNVLDRCWFDEKNCTKGLFSLEAYKKRWNKSLGCFDEVPLHDNASHGADSFRMLAVTINQTKRGMTSADLDQLKREANSDYSQIF